MNELTVIYADCTWIKVYNAIKYVVTEVTFIILKSYLLHLVSSSIITLPKHFPRNIFNITGCIVSFNVVL